MSKSNITRRRVIQGAATVAAASFVPGFMQKAEAQGQPTTPPGTRNSPTSTSVYLTATGEGAVSPNFVGLSYDKDCMVQNANYSGGTATRLFDTNATLAAFFNTIGVKMLRLASGSDTKWVGDGSGMTAGQIAPADVDALDRFLNSVNSGQTTKCTCLYGVNLGGALTPFPAESTFVYTQPNGSYAAEEMSNANSTLGSQLYGVEVGNEVNNYPKTAEYNGATWNALSALESAYTVFSDAINPSGQTALLMSGPCFDAFNTDTWQAYKNNGTSTWNVNQFATDELNNKVQLLTQHYYTSNVQTQATGPGLPGVGVTGEYNPEWNGTATTSTPVTDQGLLFPSCNASNSYLSYLLGKLSAAVTTLNTGSGPKAAFRMSECGSYSTLGGAEYYSNAYGAALWAIDFLFTCAYAGAQGVNFHGGGTLYYTPIVNTSSGGDIVLGANPMYYGILLFHMADLASLNKVSNSDSTGYINTYGGKRNSGSNDYSVIINNKNQEDYYNITLNLQSIVSNASQVGTVSLYTLTQGTFTLSGGTGSTVADVNATGSTPATNLVTIQGGTVGDTGVFSGELAAYTLTAVQNETYVQVNCYVPPASAILLQFTVTT
jgi:hypothetical protein